MATPAELQILHARLTDLRDRAIDKLAGPSEEDGPDLGFIALVAELQTCMAAVSEVGEGSAETPAGNAENSPAPSRPRHQGR